jgi:hypothetical protein
MGVIGLMLLACGVTVLLLGGHSFTRHVPNRVAHGTSWLGFRGQRVKRSCC